MSSPTEERKAHTEPKDKRKESDISPTSDDGTYVTEPDTDRDAGRLKVDTTRYVDDDDDEHPPMRTPSARREQATRLEDDLMLLQAERMTSHSTGVQDDEHDHNSMNRSRSRRSEAVDEFDEATNPLHEKTAIYKPPEKPNTQIAVFVKKLHQSSFLVRYLTYILPVVILLLIPLLVGALKYPNASVGGVELMWFAIWLEIVWLTLWAGRLVSKCFPPVVGLFASVFTNNAKKWRDMAKQIELHAALFFWWLGVEISFLPTMKNHHVDGNTATRGWEITLNKIIIVIFVWTILNFIEKILIQLIAISFHMRTYADRIEINKFQIGSLTKLYDWSRSTLGDKDDAFEEKNEQPTPSGVKTPLHYAGIAQRKAKGALNKVGNRVGDVAGAVVADVTGRAATRSTDAYQVILALLRTTGGCQVLARRLYRTFVRDGFETVFGGDLKAAFEDGEEAEAAFAMFDRDMNGDISMEELEAVCVDIGRERKSITASLKDLDSVVSKLDNVFMFFVFVIVLIVFLSLISTSAAGVLTSAGSAILALSWLFSATAQEFLQSVIFVFVKHPFDVGDRVTIYGNAGDAGLGDDYFVKEITLLYTEFKKMQGHVVQAPNSYLNGLFILNQRRSGALAEAVPIIIKYGTSIDQLDSLRQRLLEFVRSEKRDFQSNILTEMRAVTENFSLTLNVVFFYKSNWQNEGLRLQRRNKFICMLMVALQEIGIEGPRMNLQGAKFDIPFHVNYGNTRSTEQHAPIDAEEVPISEESHHLPENTGTSSGSAIRHPSILRKGMYTANARARGPSVSQRKHVDFSLGMSNMASNDIMGDVFEDRGVVVDDIVRSANRDAAERRIQEENEDEEERRSRTSSSRHRRPSNMSAPSHNDEGRRSTDAHSFRSGHSSLGRNRFFHHRSSVSHERDDLMEQGRSDEPTLPPPATVSGVKEHHN
ncbi:Mechanosensitive ion channel MscS [Penicillium expansum]|uniref:Mechanosensitive ion channel protein n=1 Tax=Penicillium expansum TaxID=27334 RepID=A0A0A2IHA8_PENEN|nr:Mechanosensitive ion channel MscS [Penicillium expansum]KGO42454.1 Mechanosensitive ion channel MscS [Penicillium expansum]KGO58368.1 Mechanosensitive ion channel MscS [Penicillium expansum]KGO64519.1 Mechanosensitive ion channel MscS [Penicillium expansum]